MVVNHKEIILRFIAFAVNNKLFKKSKMNIDSVMSMLKDFELSEYFKDILKESANQNSEKKEKI